MAILDELGLEVHIVVAGSRATEYPDPEHNADNSPPEAPPYYIESRAGEEFYISCCVIPGSSKPARQWLAKKNHRLRVDVSVDGGTTSASILLHRNGKPGRILGVTNNAEKKIYHFRFSTVSTVDESDKARLRNDVQTATHLGLIQVRVRRCLYQGLSKNRTCSYSQPKEITLAEKALKGKSVSHCTTLSSNSSATTDDVVDVQNIDSTETPYAKFCFRYRSKDDLKNEMIISRTREPSVESISELDALSPEEAQRLARKRLAQMTENLDNLAPAVIERLAREELRGANKRDDRSVTVKRERDDVPRSGRPMKYARMENGKEAIDLTDD